MKTIWKFPLVLDDSMVVRMPRGAAVLDVQVQDGVVCIWAAVDGAAPVEPRTFYLRGTGHELIPEGVQTVRHLGSFQLGSFVGHLFEPYGVTPQMEGVVTR